MRRKNDDNSATQRSIRHDIGESPRGRDDDEKERDRPTDRGDDDDDPFERGFRVDSDGGAAAENSTEWEKKKFMQDVQFSRKFESKSDPDPGRGADRARAPLG